MTSDNFDDYYEPPTQEFIRNSLTYGLKVDSSANFQPVTTPGLQSGDPVPFYMLRNRNKLVRTLIRYAYKKRVRFCVPRSLGILLYSSRTT